MWILTYEVNDYRQHGEYYKKAWAERPTKEQIVDCFKGSYKLSQNEIDNLHEGVPTSVGCAIYMLWQDN